MGKLYPIGIQNFESLRKNSYFYVDKTALIYQLTSTGSYYFLSRPRRFGKSLLISTLQAYFEGKKELFEGLAMEQLEKNWTKHPVLHIDLNAKKFDTVADLIRLIDCQLLVYESTYGACASDVSIDDRLVTLIRRAFEHTGQRVAILIDEYDKPLLQTIGNAALQKEYRETLKAFYGVLKSMDSYIKFAMLTGVTKFGKVSVFSDLNNLNDISMDDQYAALCGMTEKELHRDFEEDIQQLADAQNMSYEATCQELREYHSGYHFVENSPSIYNLCSMQRAFYNMEFHNYWFETGTPSFLVKLLKLHNYDLSYITHKETNAAGLNSFDPESANPLPILFQTGYFTIKGYDPRFRMYSIGFANREVENGFTHLLSQVGINFSKETRNIEKWLVE